MTLIAPHKALSPYRVPGWLLILSILGFVAVIVTNVVVFAPAGIGEFANQSPDAIRSVAGGWVASRIVFGGALAFCCLGYALAAGHLLPGVARGVAIATLSLCSMTVVVILISEGLAIAILDSDAATLAMDSRWAISATLGEVFITLTFFALALIALALARAGALPRLGVIVAVLAGLTGVLGAVSVAASLGIPVPPPFLGILGIALGVGLLRTPSTTS